MRIPWECPECNHQNSDTLKANKLVIEDLDPRYKHGIKFNFPSACNEDGSPLHVPIRLQLVGDELEAESFIRNVLGITKPSPELTQDVILACMLEPMGTSLEDRYNWVTETLTSADDAMCLKSFESLFDYGVMNYADFTCANCGEETSVKFKFDLVNFFPTIRDSRDVQSRILFHETSESTDDGVGERGSSEAPVSSKTTRKRNKKSQKSEGRSEIKDELIEEGNIDDIVDGR
jgi:hypothetical protein